MAFAVALAAGISLAICQWLIFVYAPVEASLGIIQKIFYLHMPLAWWALISFFMVFIASIIYLARHEAKWDHVAQACAETGLVFCGLALVTGIIWGRNSWGVWWTWDPRLTTTLIMWFIYAGYLVIRNMGLPPDRTRTVCAVTGIVAFLDVPLVFFSARIFRSIHPAVFGSQGGGMEKEMLTVLLAAIFSLGLFWLALVLARTGQLALSMKIAGLRLRVLLAAEADDSSKKIIAGRNYE